MERCKVKEIVCRNFKRKIFKNYMLQLLLLLLLMIYWFFTDFTDFYWFYVALFDKIFYILIILHSTLYKQEKKINKKKIRANLWTHDFAFLTFIIKILKILSNEIEILWIHRLIFKIFDEISNSKLTWFPNIKREKWNSKCFL